jgi:hypothetical protein
VDRINHRVKLSINTTGKVSIDNTEMIVIDLILSGSETIPVFRLTSALFTDSQGVAKSAQILPAGVIVENRVQHSIYGRGDQNLKSYLLNGKAVQQEMAERFRNEMIRGDVFLRIVSTR